MKIRNKVMNSKVKEEILNLKEAAILEISSIQNLQDLNEKRVKFLGKKGALTALLRGMAELSKEERPIIGTLVNEAKEEIEKAITEKENILQEKEIQEKLNRERLDITIPSTKIRRGSKHPMNLIIEELEDFFVSMGYDVV